jgi:hypothetical protein
MLELPLLVFNGYDHHLIYCPQTVVIGESARQPYILATSQIDALHKLWKHRFALHEGGADMEFLAVGSVRLGAVHR